ncbi:MFS transporter [Saccharopolyspora erythraea]|uniref:MFS transporter n=1 Tax=Saccharopolyspora erythraea TaxID=1836 RepID=UPI001BA9E275|nr:MFS transporter [Saccharopolyspora erythraea]
MAAFATFAIGFLFRPLGSVVFGHFGDKLGRKAMLVLTLLLMGTASTLIGVLPTYGSAGIAAPVLLVVLRAVQGFAVGGEWGGAALMAVEHAPDGKKGLYGSWVQVGASGGLLLASGLYSLSAALTTPEQFMAWGWRIPFLASAVVVAIGFVVRSKVEETPVFEEARCRGDEPKMPLLAAIRDNPRGFVLIFLMRLAELVSFYVVTTFALSYATTHLGVAESVMLTGNTLVAALGIVVIPLAAALSDRIGRRRVFLGGAAAGVVLSVPLFWGMQSAVPALIWLAAIGVINLCHDPVVSVQQPLFTEMFGARFRYSGAGVGYQVAGALGGGFTPLVAGVLVNASGGGWTLVALFLALSCGASLVAGLMMAKDAPAREPVVSAA